LENTGALVVMEGLHGAPVFSTTDFSAKEASGSPLILEKSEAYALDDAAADGEAVLQQVKAEEEVLKKLMAATQVRTAKALAEATKQAGLALGDSVVVHQEHVLKLREPRTKDEGHGGGGGGGVEASSVSPHLAAALAAADSLHFDVRFEDAVALPLRRAVDKVTLQIDRE
jgi:hypothetical protein